MNVKTVKISEVKQNPNNPRTIRDDKFTKLVASIKAFPEMLNIRPIVVNNDMVVLGGNMRLKACREAGLKQVPIIVANELTEAQQREFIIKDNVSGGEWDWSALTSEWDTERLEDWGLDVTGFDTVNDSGGDPFDDDGIDAKNQYGVIVICASDDEQEHIFTRLTGEGFNCKIVVT
jgi:ParB-like chromosome segregation protein Spo0J